MRSPSTATTSKRTRALGATICTQSAASLRSVRRLRASTAETADPKRRPLRALTSIKTIVSPSRQTMSTSPPGSRRLRVTTDIPEASRNCAARASPARPLLPLLPGKDRLGYGFVVGFARKTESELSLPDAPPRRSVVRRGAVLLERGDVLGRAISFMVGKAVPGLNLVQLHQETVAVDLGQDRGRCHQRTAGVALDERLLRAIERFDPHCIGNQVVRCDRQARDGAFHCQNARPVDVEPVDLLHAGLSDSPSSAKRADLLGDARTQIGPDLLGIVQAADHHGMRGDDAR